MHVLDFLTELQNTEVPVTLLKSDCTTDALTANSRSVQRKALVLESVFVIVIGG